MSDPGAGPDHETEAAGTVDPAASPADTEVLPEGHDGDGAAFERLLDFLKESRSFDFTGYKRPSLVRRVRHRMHEIGVERYEDYQDVLQLQPDEFTALFNTILINVTSFFRDAEAWAHLRAEALPLVLEHKGEDPIRVWSAGCATGEEAYSLAIARAEELGVKKFRQRVKISATDVDEEALA